MLKGVKFSKIKNHCSQHVLQSTTCKFTLQTLDFKTKQLQIPGPFLNYKKIW